MPYHKKYRKKRKYRRKKRYYKKRRSPRNHLTWLRLRTVSAVPDMIICKLKYTADISENASSLNTRLIALNGLFDPDLTFIGHQPMGFDQWMAFYSKYEVRASKISLQLTNNGTVEFRSIIYPSTDIIPVSPTGTAVEQPYSRNIVLGDNVGQPSKYVSNYITVKKLEGRNIDSINFTGNSVSNPAATLYWHILSHSLDNISNLDMRGRFNIVYYCRFFARRALPQS